MDDLGSGIVVRGAPAAVFDEGGRLDRPASKTSTALSRRQRVGRRGRHGPRVRHAVARQRLAKARRLEARADREAVRVLLQTSEHGRAAESRPAACVRAGNGCDSGLRVDAPRLVERDGDLRRRHGLGHEDVEQAAVPAPRFVVERKQVVRLSRRVGKSTPPTLPAVLHATKVRLPGSPFATITCAL